jgi:hypothetical protein
MLTQQLEDQLKSENERKKHKVKEHLSNDDRDKNNNNRNQSYHLEVMIIQFNSLLLMCQVNSLNIYIYI